MDINEIRNEVLTEDAKMEKIADYIEQDIENDTLDGVLAKGDTAIGKMATFRTVESEDDRTGISATQIYGQKTLSNGVADFELTSDGLFSIGFQANNGNALSIFQIAMENGTPRVLMSDDIKAAFKAELGIS